MLDLKKLDLRKQLVLDKVEEKTHRRDLKAEIVFALDYSGSMESLYMNNTVQETVERVLAAGMALDPDQKVDLLLFHHDVLPMDVPLTVNTTEGYIKKHVYPKIRMGSTCYAPVINEIVEKYKPKEVTVTKGGMFGFGGTKVTTIEPMKYPVFVAFITDGENDTQEKQSRAAEKALIEASKYGIFFQFIGIGRENFKFLSALDTMEGRVIDNANFFKLPDLRTTTDEELLGKMFVEFPDWFALAESKDMFVKQ